MSEEHPLKKEAEEVFKDMILPWNKKELLIYRLLRKFIKEKKLVIPESEAQFTLMVLFGVEVKDKAQHDFTEKVEKKLNERITNCKVDSFYKGADLGIKEALKIIKKEKELNP